MTHDASTDGSCLRVPGLLVRWWARWGCYVAPALIFLALTLPKLGQGGFRTDTGRYAAVGLQMWRTGEFWTPYLQPDTEYFNKPPLVLWIHGAALEVLDVGVWQARLPSVLAALGCVLVLVAITRRYANRTRALMVGVALATTLEFFRRTKEVSIDMWQVLFLLGAVWCVSVAVTRARQRAAGDAGWFALAGVGIGLALLCKPLAGLLAVPILGVWLLSAGQWRRVGWLALTTLVAVVVAGPWHVSMAQIHGEAFTGQYFGKEIADRAAGEIMSEPWFYYFNEMVQYHWPWLGAAVGGLIGWLINFPRGFGRADRRGLLLGVVWSVGWLALLSSFPDKRPRYGLLFYPGLALVSGIWLFDVVPVAWRRSLVRKLAVIVAVVGVGGLGLALAPVRVNRPADPGYAAVGEWMNAHPERPVMIGTIGSNENGWVYLLTGRWAYRVGGEAYPEAPAGAVWVWIEHETPKRKLPRGHEVILDVGAARLSERP
ncbi:MAG: hypothetical protein DHS20C14_13790 [Phycisphaeraceae bacterium]|nr:MAG: hypothetical protein DHS20C14_13790 [Phycisphaeraceae bacterium]